MSRPRNLRIPVATMAALALASSAVAVPHSPLVPAAIAQDQSETAVSIPTKCTVGLSSNGQLLADLDLDATVPLNVTSSKQIRTDEEAEVSITVDPIKLLLPQAAGQYFSLFKFVAENSEITIDINGTAEGVELVNAPEGVSIESGQIKIRDFIGFTTDPATPSVDILVEKPIELTMKAATPGTIVLNPNATMAIGNGTATVVDENGDPQIDPDTGEAGVYQVNVTCPISATDTVLANINVSAPIADDFDPAYAPVTVTAGEEATAPALEIEEGAEVTSDAPDWITIDPATGAATINPAADTPAGTTTVNVTVTYSDGSTDTLQLVVDVEAEVPDNEEFQPVYTDATVQAGGDAVTATVDLAGAPADTTTFAAGADAPAWAAVAADGTVTLTPGADITPGDYTVPVTVTYDDDTTETINLAVTVTEAAPIADEYDPSYETVDVTAGEEATTPALDIEEGATVTSDAPEWITIDPATGAATITPAEDAAEGTTTVNVTVTYSDGSTDTLQLVVNVEEAQADEPDAGGSLGSGDLGSLFGSDSSSTDGSSSLGIFGIIATILAVLGLGGWAWYEWDQNNNRR